MVGDDRKHEEENTYDPNTHKRTYQKQ